jgi:hypothetical protein
MVLSLIGIHRRQVAKERLLGCRLALRIHPGSFLSGWALPAGLRLRGGETSLQKRTGQQSYTQ